jgi:hypothetical protein
MIQWGRGARGHFLEQGFELSILLRFSRGTARAYFLVQSFDLNALPQISGSAARARTFWSKALN